MPTEASVIEYLWMNWPSVLIALLSGFLYVAAYIKLSTFLARIDTLEKELLKQAKEGALLKIKIAQILLVHCRKYPDDLDRLMSEHEECDT